MTVILHHGCGLGGRFFPRTSQLYQAGTLRAK